MLVGNYAVKHLLNTSLLFAGLASFGLAACVIDTVPLPDIQGERTYGGDNADGGSGGAAGVADKSPWDDQMFGTIVGINTTSIYWADEGPFIFLVGVAGAFPGAGLVIVSNPAREDEYRSASSADGSFAAAINAKVFDTIQVSFVQNNTLVDSVLIDLIPASVEAYRANATLDADDDGMLPPTTAGAADPDVQTERSSTNDTVTVYGLPGILPAGIVIVIANPRLNVAVRTLTETNGSFIAVIRADPGDELLVFTVEPAASNGGSSTLILVVP